MFQVSSFEFQVENAGFPAAAVLNLKLETSNFKLALVFPQVGGSGGIRARQPEVPVGRNGGDAPARGSLQVSLLYQVGLEHVLDGIALLADRRGQIVHTDRSAAEFLDDRLQQLAI